jgi:hypothetical protein
VWRAHAADPIFPTDPKFSELWRAPELMAVSCFILLPGIAAIPFLRPRWVAAAFGAGVIIILISGFYPFRIPYLLMYAVAAIALTMAHAKPGGSQVAWRRLLFAGAMISAVLAFTRFGFSLVNEARPDPQGAFVARLQPQTRVADFSWDFYEAGRLAGMKMMRSYPAIKGEAVDQWLQVARPELVVRAVNPLGTWVMVDDLDSRLRQYGYCEIGWTDFHGKPWTEGRRARPVPSPLLWRLGLFRDHGPYVLWVPCQQTGG